MLSMLLHHHFNQPRIRERSWRHTVESMRASYDVGVTALHSFHVHFCRLTIYGSGFGDMYSEPATVFVGTYPCGVIHHLSSSEIVSRAVTIQ